MTDTTNAARELMASRATDEDRLQVLICLVADLSARVDALANMPRGEPRFGPPPEPSTEELAERMGEFVKRFEASPHQPI